MTDWLKELMEQTSNRAHRKPAWLDGYSPILIYGAGTMAQDIHRVFNDNGLPVHGFIDHMQRENQTLNGMPVFNPGNAKVFGRTGGDAVVVLGIHNYQANVPQIVKNLKSNGFNHIVSTVELYDHFGKELGVRYWLTSRDFYPPLESILEELLALWSDDSSRKLLRAVIEFRLSGDAEKLPAPDLINPYHPADIPAWRQPIRFVDCGAFDGDTLADFIKNKIKIEAVAAFEPDLNNFSRLAGFAASHRDQISNIALWPCGVFSSTTQLSFETGKGMASNISASGKTVVQCVSLDSAIPTFAPNLIKMDIEGAEYDALLGARELISTHTPGLAVSLYHRPEHLWQLPLLVERIAPGKYQFFMRSHALNDFELVLYAIPK